MPKYNLIYYILLLGYKILNKDRMKGQTTLRLFQMLPKCDFQSYSSRKSCQNESIRSNHSHFKSRHSFLLKIMPIRHEIHAQNHEKMKKYLSKLRTQVFKIDKSLKKQEFSYRQERTRSCILQKSQKKIIYKPKKSINDFIIAHSDTLHENTQRNYNFSLILHNELIKNDIKTRYKQQKEEITNKNSIQTTRHNPQTQLSPIQLKREMRYRISRLPRFKRQNSPHNSKMRISVTGWRQSQQVYVLQQMQQLPMP